MIEHRNYTFGSVLALLLSMQASFAQEVNVDLLGESIAELMGYPAQRLNVLDVTSGSKAKAKGGVLAGLVLEGKDSTFATMAVGISKRRFILTPELESYCEDALAEMDEEMEQPISKISFASDAYGYTGLGVLGAGGSSERIIATWPAQGIDIQITISMSEDGLAFDDHTKEYYQLISEGGESLADRLVNVMEMTLEFAQKWNIGTPPDANVESSEVNVPTQSQPPFVFPGRSLSLENDNTIHETKDGGSRWRWLIALAFATLSIGGSVWLFLRTRK